MSGKSSYPSVPINVITEMAWEGKSSAVVRLPAMWLHYISAFTRNLRFSHLFTNVVKNACSPIEKHDSNRARTTSRSCFMLMFVTVDRICTHCTQKSYVTTGITQTSNLCTSFKCTVVVPQLTSKSHNEREKSV